VRRVGCILLQRPSGTVCLWGLMLWIRLSLRCVVRPTVLSPLASPFLFDGQVFSPPHPLHRFSSFALIAVSASSSLSYFVVPSFLHPFSPSPVRSFPSSRLFLSFSFLILCLSPAIFPSPPPPSLSSLYSVPFCKCHARLCFNGVHAIWSEAIFVSQ
jgi:hypothetical protein